MSPSEMAAWPATVCPVPVRLAATVRPAGRHRRWWIGLHRQAQPPSAEHYCGASRLPPCAGPGSGNYVPACGGWGDGPGVRDVTAASRQATRPTAAWRGAAATSTSSATPRRRRFGATDTCTSRRPAEAELVAIEAVYERFLRGEIAVAGKDFNDMTTGEHGTDPSRLRDRQRDGARGATTRRGRATCSSGGRRASPGNCAARAWSSTSTSCSPSSRAATTPCSTGTRTRRTGSTPTIAGRRRVGWPSTTRRSRTAACSSCPGATASRSARTIPCTAIATPATRS